MGMKKFIEKGFTIEENVPMDWATFSIDLEGIESITDETFLSGEVKDLSYGDGMPFYDVLDFKNNYVKQELTFEELQEFVNNF